MKKYLVLALGALFTVGLVFADHEPGHEGTTGEMPAAEAPAVQETTPAETAAPMQEVNSAETMAADTSMDSSAMMNGAEAAAVSATESNWNGDECCKPRCCKPRCCKPRCEKPRCCKPRCCKPKCCKPRCCKPRCCKPRCEKPRCCKPRCCKPRCASACEASSDMSEMEDTYAYRDSDCCRNQIYKSTAYWSQPKCYDLTFYKTIS